jgi:hypothetical protein
MDSQREQEALRTLSLHRFAQIEEENEKLKKENEELRRKEPKIKVMVKNKKQWGFGNRCYFSFDEIDVSKIFEKSNPQDDCICFFVSLSSYGVHTHFHIFARPNGKEWIVPNCESSDEGWIRVEYIDPQLVEFNVDMKEFEDAVSKIINNVFEKEGYSFSFREMHDASDRESSEEEEELDEWKEE